MPSKSMLYQIRDEAEKAKRDSAKGKLKKLYSDYNNASEVVSGIENQIVELLQSIGESEQDIRNILDTD